ncbi:MAG: F0F1 ATP synthase subunit gamma, partial [Victivallales bacterium]|nr:F0F1 ATP synthase subunit gamma [Victivallales bacterium]
MAGKRDLLRKVSSLKNTEKITSAMKMIASTKLQRMQRALVETKPFGDALEEMNARLGAFEAEDDSPNAVPLPKGFSGKLHIILFTGDRGLCGSFNSAAQKTAAAIIDGFKLENYSITAYGAKGIKFCKSRDLVVGDRIAPLPKVPKLVDTAEKAKEMLDGLSDGRFDEVLLVYNRYISTLEQVPVVRRLLLPPSEDPETNLWDLEFEP